MTHFHVTVSSITNFYEIDFETAPFLEKYL